MTIYEYLVHFEECDCGIAYPHPEAVHESIGLKLILVQSVLSNNTRAALHWVSSTRDHLAAAHRTSIPTAEHLARLPRCERPCLGQLGSLDPHPAAAHQELDVCLAVLEAVIPRGVPLVANHWLFTARRQAEALGHVAPPCPTVRVVRRPGRPTLTVIRGWIP